MIIKPSQWLNIGWILFGLLGFTLIIPPIIAAYKIIELYTWTYQIDHQRIIEKKGVFSVTHREMSFYRIKSFRYDQPFLMRLVGIGNLYILSSEPYSREWKLEGVYKGTDLWKELRAKTLNNRNQYGVKEYDLFNL